MIALNAKYELRLILVLLSIFFADCSNKNTRRSRIAIIGGGIGGTATAYELSKLAAKDGHDISLDLYEAAQIGGRLATTKIHGFEFETGGSIIHAKNKHMTEYVESNGLHWYNEPPRFYGIGHVTGLYNGEEFVFISSDSYVKNEIRLVWRYGMYFLNVATELVNPLLFYFERIYEAQEKQIQFDDVHSLLGYMSEDFPGLMEVKFNDYLQAQGYGYKFINEFIFLTTKTKSNQHTDIPAFVGSLLLADAQAGYLRRVDGGNKRVPETLLAQSDARLIEARVESVTLRPDSTFALAVNNASHVYDYVVIAFPIMENSKNKIQFEGFPELNIPLMKYQKTVVTLVHGELNYTFFHYESSKEFPNRIFSVNDDLFYNSISVETPVSFDPQYDCKVFKIYSKDILTDKQLNLLFRTRNKVTVAPWLAYPLYDTESRNLSFVLHNNLFYVNAIEWAASSMEMSAISGVNVALHIHKILGN